MTTPSGPRFKKGPLTLIAGATILEDQIVVPGSGGTAGKAIVAGADATNALGVARVGAVAAGTDPVGVTVDVLGNPIMSTAGITDEFAAERHGVFRLRARGTIAFGDKIKCGATGGVVKWVPGTDLAETKIGQCVDPAGGVNAGRVICEVDFI